MGAFHAYDIRGIYNTDFNKEDAYKIGFFLPSLLKTNKILVGRDARLSSPEIFEYLSKGIVDSGSDVYDLGLSTTPMVYYCTAKFNFDASVMITASHNAKEYNGLKVSKTGARPVGYDVGLKELEKLITEKEVIPIEKKGKIISFNKRSEYISFLNSYKSDIDNLNFGIDCSNGMASLLIKDILGTKPDYIFDELDGNFPNHDPNPLIIKNVEALQNLVIENKYDLGIIFDGDADRVMFVDENGEFVSPDLIIGLMAHYFLINKKGNVLQDIRTSKAVGEYIQKFGSTMHTWRVGRAYATLKLREINGIYGGELAGHYYFRDFYYSDSGILAALIVLNVLAKMKKQNKTFSQLIAEIKSYFNSGEINYKIEKKLDAMNALKEFFEKEEKPTAFYDFDGYRLEFKDWWFNVRPSNTEPYLRFLAEANDELLLKNKLKEVESILGSFK
ncbi:MAG: phosphomannomutase/phosphoglucomutase [Chlorobi bacterium]|nr:phosphomannomutase/phosphoglucomutase [Chlorobiota bacterium]